MKTLRIFLILSFVSLFPLSCVELEVENLNSPDVKRVISTPDDLEGVVRGAFVQYYNGLYSVSTSPNIHLDGLADCMTTTNAFSRFWDFTNEPRVRINNTLTYSGLPVIQRVWRQAHAVVSSANDVLDAIENRGIDPGEKKAMLLATAYFIKGIALGDLANLYDRAFSLEPGQPVSEARLSSYQEILDKALFNLDKAIEIADDNEFTLPDFWFGMEYTNLEFAEVVNSFAARYVINNGRTPSEYNNEVYQKALEYAQNGISQDLVIETDGNVLFNYYTWISGLYWYFRIDNRLIAQMSNDPNYPTRYPIASAGTAIPATTSNDARFTTDFRYDNRMNAFNIARGPQLQSTYFFVRYEQNYLNTNANGPAPLFLKAENDMIRAEANLRLGNLAEAINIVNQSTRITRGQLPELTDNSTTEQIAKAIYYEIEVECLRTGFGIQYYAMRRRGALQEGTPLMFPIPADELVTIGEPNYSFGGVNFAGQVGTSDGTNSWDQ